MKLYFAFFLVLGENVMLEGDYQDSFHERIEDDSDIVKEIEVEILKLTKSTKESKRDENVEKYEKIFLRLAATGAQALGRNMLYASTQTVFQGDDDEENDEDEKRAMRDVNVKQIEDWKDSDLEDTGRSQYVTQILGEPLYYVPASYWLQVIGRSLTGAGFLGGTVVGLRKLKLKCSLDNWSSLLSAYNSAYYPYSNSQLSSAELSFRLAQFIRRAKTELSCLQGTGYLHLLLDQLNIVLGDKIGQNRSGVQGISDELLENSILTTYDTVEKVKSSLSSDWLTSSSVTTTLLLSKGLGFFLITWGRNIGDWPTDVSFSEVSTGYRVGIMGRALLYTLFVLDDFRKLEGYSAPSCDSGDIFQVLSKYSKLLYADQSLFSASQRRLEIKKFAFELETSVVCLTSTPSQFLALDSLEADQEALKLKDNLQDIINIVDLRRNNLP